MGFINRVTFLVFTPILIAAGAACSEAAPEPTDQPIVITPVAFRTQTPAERLDWREFMPSSTPIPAAVVTATPIPLAVATPTLTPWPTATATPLPLPTATPLPVPTAAPAATRRPTNTPTPTVAERWVQIQRDYRDERITYDQAVEQAVDTGMSRPQARIALSQMRQPGEK